MTEIKHTPGVCGGRACVNNTRIAVWLIAQCWLQLCDREAVVERWTWEGGLSREDVLYAIDWYLAHPEGIDQDIRENALAVEKLPRA